MLDFTGVKAIAIPEGNVKKITANGTVLWEAPSFKNWVPYSTTSDGKTIFNGTGYKNGVRIRSGGAEGSVSYGSCTGFMPVKGGDVVRLSGYDVTNTAGAANAINVADGTFTNLGQLACNSPNWGYGIIQESWSDYNWGAAKGVKEESPGVYVWTVPPDSRIAYIRVSGHTSGDGSKMIVTINEEIS